MYVHTYVCAASQKRSLTLNAGSCSLQFVPLPQESLGTKVSFLLTYREPRCKFFYLGVDFFYLGFNFSTWVSTFSTWVSTFLPGFQLFYLGFNFSTWVSTFIPGFQLFYLGVNFSTQGLNLAPGYKIVYIQGKDIYVTGCEISLLPCSFSKRRNYIRQSDSVEQKKVRRECGHFKLGR
jgi:hypothetical protein